MSAELLFALADAAWFIGRLCALLILGALLALAAIVLAHALTTGLSPAEQARRARHAIDDARCPSSLVCEDCGSTTCDCGPVALREAAQLEEGLR